MSEETKAVEREKARTGMQIIREGRTEEEQEVENEESREGMRRARAKKTDEELEEKKQIDRKDKKKARAMKTDEEQEEEKQIAREYMKKVRDRKTDEEYEEEKQIARESMKKIRGMQIDVELDFNMISTRHRMRDNRSKRSGKEHLKENLKAKQGMRLIKEEGRINSFGRRFRGKRDDLSEWKTYMKNSYSKCILEQYKPDIVERINEEVRIQKEKERIEKEKERKEIEENGGEWLYHGDCGEWYWSGEGEPPGDYGFHYEAPTAEELEEIRKQDEELYEEELKEKRKVRENKIKGAMATPINPFPERELCSYETLREVVLSQRKRGSHERKWIL